MTTDEIRFRRGTPEDTDAICALLDEVFPGSAKSRPDILRWQYWDNPFGETESAIAETGEGVIGHYAAFPIPGLADGKKVTIGMGADAATRPAARGKGVFSTLTTQAWNGLIERNHAPFVLTAPNPNSKGAAARTGMVAVDDLPAWVRPVDPSVITDRIPLPKSLAAGIIQVGFRATSTRGLVVEITSTLPDGLAPLCAHAAQQVRWGVDPSLEWLQWRFADRPGDDYTYVTARRGREVRALAVCTDEQRDEGRFRLVLELLSMDEEAGAAALSAAVEDAAGRLAVALVGSPSLAGVDAGRDPVTRAARRAGFRRLPRRLEPRPLCYGVVPGPGLPDPTHIPWRTQWSFLDHL